VDTLIGVKNLPWAPLAKKDLLLFDKILVPHLHFYLGIANAALRADLEWLVEAAMLEESAPPFAAHTAEAATDRLTPALNYLSVLSFQFADVLGSAVDMDPELVRQVTSEAVSVLSTRIVAAHTQKLQGIRCVPMIHSAEGQSGFDVFGTFSSFLPHIVRLLDSISAGRIQLPPVVGVDPSDELTREFVDSMTAAVEEIKASQSAGEVHTSPVLDLVLKELPLPDETVPWDKIRDFRQNEDARANLLALRHWTRKVAAANTPAMEIREELEHLRASFDSHMRFHRMKTRPGVLRTLVSLPTALGKAAKLDFGGAVDALLIAKTREIALLEAERSAPGREVAFISKAAEKFG
jgi:hypothetical protein